MPSVSADSPLAPRDAERIASSALENGGLERVEAERLGWNLGNPGVRQAVAEAAVESKRRGKGEIVTVSRNVFVPLTNLCRNRCTYCTFVKGPNDPEARTYDLEEVSKVVRNGVRVGCTEALFCLGDKPERIDRRYRRWLEDGGYESTPHYLIDACQVAVAGGMLPHSNAGILTQEQMARLRPWNASMGLMLETTSRRLRQQGMAHFWAPDKEPSVRIRMHREAGELGIPFTSGILLGIGEHAGERVDTLLTIRALADRYRNVQETIVQPFHPKPDTKMHDVPALSGDEVVGWVALARLILGPEMNLQAPPNLASDLVERLLAAGVNDWGGVSPLTIDFINPEAPWPRLAELRRRTHAAGQHLRERLPVYPEHLLGRPELFDPRMRERLLSFADAAGYARPRPRRAREEAA